MTFYTKELNAEVVNIFLATLPYRETVTFDGNDFAYLDGDISHNPLAEQWCVLYERAQQVRERIERHFGLDWPEVSTDDFFGLEPDGDRYAEIGARWPEGWNLIANMRAEDSPEGGLMKEWHESFAG